MSMGTHDVGAHLIGDRGLGCCELGAGAIADNTRMFFSGTFGK